MDETLLPAQLYVWRWQPVVPIQGTGSGVTHLCQTKLTGAATFQLSWHQTAACADCVVEFVRLPRPRQ